MDARIRELQQRLKKRQAQELQMKQQHQRQAQEQTKSTSNQNNAASTTSISRVNALPGRNVATVEPYIQYAPQHVAKDDLYSKSIGANFLKQDPKYQTLPARVKPMPRNGDSGGNARPAKPAEMNNNSELIEEYQLPTVVPSRPSANTPGTEPKPGDPTYQNVMVQFPHSNAQLRPGTKQPASGGHGSAQLFFPDKSSQPHQQHPALLGAGDGPTLNKMSGPLPFNPVINIHEEERQAGSGQSSPASSEASNSSGGIQIKGDSEVSLFSFILNS